MEGGLEAALKAGENFDYYKNFFFLSLFSSKSFKLQQPAMANASKYWSLNFFHCFLITTRTKFY